jgi:hypothetical protein
MSKFEMACATVVLVIDIIVIMLLSSGTFINQTLITITLFLSGLVLGNILYCLILQDWVKSKVGKE